MASGPKAYEPIPFESYSVCKGSEGSGNRCCIIWGNRLRNARHRDLVNAAKKISTGCAYTIPPADLGGFPRVNGRAKGVLIGDLCTVECLGNKPEDDCSTLSPF
jgi:hypothetical protein